MGKLLRPRDVLLLGLAGILDMVEEVRDPMQILSKGYENMYGFVPRTFKRGNYNHLVWRNLKTGYIEKVEKDGEIYLRLTSQGQKKIERDFPLLDLQRSVWDRKWRLVIFDIQEIDRLSRDRLRGKLKELGFGMLQKSVFITPHDVLEDFSEFIHSLNLDEYVYMLEVSKIIAGNSKALSRKIWKLDAINSMYKNLIETIESKYLISSHDRGNKLNSKEVRKLQQMYVEILLQDPFLPRELLPTDWKAEEAKKHIKKLVKYSKYE